MDVRMPQTQREQLMFAIGFLALVGAGAYWYLSYNPKTAALATRTEQVVALEERNARARADLARGTVAQLTSQADAYEANLELMKQLVPESNQLSTLVDQISTAARRVGLDVGSLAPLATDSAPYFDTYKYELTVTGGYHTVAEFLTNVASLPRIVVPVNVRMVAAPPEQITAERTVVTGFQLHTYVLKPPAAPAAAPPAGAPPGGG